MFTRRATLAAGAGLAAAPAMAGDRPLGRAFAGRSAVYAKDGMVATSQPLATAAGLAVLKQGGSAIDAAIAANACLGVMEPTGCGVGGDLFAIVWDPKTAKLHAINASGPAPRGQTLAQAAARAKGPIIPPLGVRCATVPGAVDGWLQLHAKFGKLRLSDVLQPAIGYARDGHPVAPIIAQGWARNFSRFEQGRADIEEFDNAKKAWLIGGRAPRAGEMFANPDLARTYTNIAVYGRDWFYEGDGADILDRYMQRVGGPLTKADMAAYRAQWVEPISTRYRGVDVFQIPPNSQGLTVLQILNILEGFDLQAMGFGSADALHVAAEAKKLAFADRARFIADPDFARLPVAQLLDKSYAARQRATIKMDRATPARDIKGYAGGDTIYMCAADKSGMMVSLIQSNYRGMGSGIVPDGLGFMLQNRGSQFNLNPAHANVYAPGKRPFHTIIPGFAMKGGQPWLAFGVMGGDMQPQGHAQIMTNLVDFGMDVQEAGDAPRWRDIGGPDADGSDGAETLYLESQIGADVRKALVARGHVMASGYQDVGGYQAIAREGGVFIGASEMRKDGMAAGY
ncbi:MAG: gamma-glutamyltransferase [Caulobacterales bacterium]